MNNIWRKYYIKKVNQMHKNLPEGYIRVVNNSAWKRYYMAIEMGKLHRGLPSEYHSMRSNSFDWQTYIDRVQNIEFVCAHYDNMREAYFK